MSSRSSVGPQTTALFYDAIVITAVRIGMENRELKIARARDSVYRYTFEIETLARKYLTERERHVIDVQLIFIEIVKEGEREREGDLT